MSQPPSTCSRCGTALPNDKSEGGCPKCLAAALFTPPDSEFGVSADARVIRYFGDYQLLEEIAQGGMGVVYKARQVTLNRLVAVKMIRAGLLASDAEIQRFRTEAEAAGQLRHPNIVAIHEVGEHDGQHYFSMDFIEGRTLAELIREHPWPGERAASCIRTITEAVHYSHQRGILHRDLKPSNVIVDPCGVPHIMDFGLARRMEEDSTLTQSGMVVGTPSYMAPEQTVGKQVPNAAIDVYSLGAILYELLTGSPPFRGETMLDTLKLVRETEPVAPRLLNPKVSRDLETICLKCLQKQASRRYGTASELAADLGRFLNMEPIRARPVGLWEKGWRWGRRRPALAASLGGLFLAVAGGLTGILWQWHLAEENSTQLQITLAESELITEMATGSDRELMLAAYGDKNFQLRRFQRLGNMYEMRDGNEALIKTRLGTARISGGANFVSERLRSAETNASAFPPLSSNHVPRTVSAHLGTDEKRAAAVFADGTASVLDLHTRSTIGPVLRHSLPINVAQFSPDEELVATGSSDSTIRIWHWQTGRLIAELRQPERSAVSGLRFTASGGHLVSMNVKRVLTVWNTRTWQVHRSRTIQVSPLSIHIQSPLKADKQSK